MSNLFLLKCAKMFQLNHKLMFERYKRVTSSVTSMSRRWDFHQTEGRCGQFAWYVVAIEEWLSNDHLAWVRIDRWERANGAFEHRRWKALSGTWDPTLRGQLIAVISAKKECQESGEMLQISERSEMEQGTRQHCARRTRTRVDDRVSWRTFHACWTCFADIGGDIIKGGRETIAIGSIWPDHLPFGSFSLCLRKRLPSTSCAALEVHHFHSLLEASLASRRCRRCSGHLSHYLHRSDCKVFQLWKPLTLWCESTERQTRTVSAGQARLGCSILSSNIFYCYCSNS